MSNGAIPPGWTPIDLTVEMKAVMLRSAAAPHNPQLSRAARELSKHDNIVRALGAEVGVSDRVSGDQRAKEEVANRIVDYFLNNGAAFRRSHKKWGQVIDIKLPDGLGVRYSSSLEFRFFLGRDDD